MKRFFLIDYENVSDSGLDGFFDLTSEDTVYIFYTVNACKIGIEFVDRLRKQYDCASLQFIRAATGNQALDFQLSSFLGGLIAENPGDDCTFYIISKDRGYSCLPGFWAAMRPGVRLNILPRISEESRKRAKAQSAVALPETETVIPQAEAVQPAKAEPVIPVAAEAPAEPEPVEEVVTASESPETDSEEAAPVPEKAVPQPVSSEAKPSATGRRSRRGRSAVKKDATAEAEEAEVPSAPSAAKPSGKKALAPADRAVMNTAVQQVLSKAKYDNAIISGAASLVIKMYKDGSNMQELYRGFIKSFGREQGLEVYNLIKPVLM